MLTAPFTTVRSPGAAVATADQLATAAGVSVAASGGNAVDAALAANAVLAVTAPHLCGMGGDLFALVHVPGEQPAALNASGRAPASADAGRMRSEGLSLMPFRHDIRSVTVPGCVDGWCALHDRFGSLPLPEILAPARRLALDGFPASPLLVGSLARLDAEGSANLIELTSHARHPGARVRRPGVAAALDAIGAAGRDGFYGDGFGTGLVTTWPETFTSADLVPSQADWVTPLSISTLGRTLWTVPPNSQGYLTLAAAWVVEGLDLPNDADEPTWAHLLVEASKAVGSDRPEVLHEGASGSDLLRMERLVGARARVGETASSTSATTSAGDTTYLCTTDRDGMAVSLIQSNASGFGSWLVEPTTGINLHNRGLGFSLQRDHPGELRPGARPPHTLSPLLVTHHDGSLAAVLGTMGGDAQPQILLQILTRLLWNTHGVAASIAAPRWVLNGPRTGFDTWSAGTTPSVLLEGHAPPAWRHELERRGHHVEMAPPFDPGAFGHAHAIVVDEDGFRCAAADPRARIGSAGGL